MIEKNGGFCCCCGNEIPEGRQVCPICESKASDPKVKLMKGLAKMKIPKKIKIGGKVYKVEKTDRLNLGHVNYSGEIDYVNLVIRIVPSAKGKMEADFLHELCHGIFNHLGYTDHDEKKIDELANALYMIIQDNPEIFEKEV